MKKLPHKRKITLKRLSELNDGKITKKEFNLIEKYVVGDHITISIRKYAKMYNEYLNNIKMMNSDRKFTKEKVAEQIKHNKHSRPILVLWGNEFSDYIIASSMTTKKKKNLNYEISENSFVAYDVLLMHKDSSRSLYGGKIFSKHQKEEIDLFLEQFKINRPKSYSYLIEKLNELKEIASEREINYKNKLIEDLMKKQE